MSEVNYRRNGNKYSSSGKCWGLSPKIGNPPSCKATEDKGAIPLLPAKWDDAALLAGSRS